MPNYAWTCHSCEKPNNAGADICAFCGFTASASGRDIFRSRNTRTSIVQHGQEGLQTAFKPEAQTRYALRPARRPNAGHGVLFIVFGTFCLAGAFVSVSRARWPMFMPVQLDAIAIPLSFLSERVGAYVGGVLAAVVGLLCVGGGIAILKKSG